MLNKDGIRELAYIVKIDNITAIPGYDYVFISCKIRIILLMN